MATHRTSATLLNKRGREGIVEIEKIFKKEFHDFFANVLGRYSIVPYVTYVDYALNNEVELFGIEILYEKVGPYGETKQERLDCQLVGRTVQDVIFSIQNFVQGYKMKV